jgi:hypothetical protein
MKLWKHIAWVALFAFVSGCAGAYVLVDRSKCKNEHGVVAECQKVE